MGMGSNNKKSSSTGVVVWCIVLGLALLVVEAAAKDASYCENLCRGRPYLQYIRCLDGCMLSPGHGAAARLAGHRSTAREEARVGVVGVGGRASLLAMPAERAGLEEEEKRKHLAEPHGDAPYCSAFCNGRLDFGPCYNECFYGRVTGQEEARVRGTGALNVLVAARHEVAVGACSSTVYVEACYACCQREVRRIPDFDWYACIRSCHDEDALPINKKRENNKEGAVPPAK